MPTSSAVLIDDRLLVDHLLGRRLPRRKPIFTTSYWYYRAGRAAVAGGTGHLSGPFQALPPSEQAQAIASLLALPTHIGLPAPRDLVPAMIAVSRRHARLNLLNIEAVAAAQLLDAELWLSDVAARGVLAGVLDTEGIAWKVLSIEQ